MTLTDKQGAVKAWASGGSAGFRNANKSTPLAAERAAAELAKRAKDLGFYSVVIKFKGMGMNKQIAAQTLARFGITISELHDVTPVPYNGCRPKKKRRV